MVVFGRHLLCHDPHELNLQSLSFQASVALQALVNDIGEASYSLVLFRLEDKSLQCACPNHLRLSEYRSLEHSQLPMKVSSLLWRHQCFQAASSVLLLLFHITIGVNPQPLVPTHRDHHHLLDWHRSVHHKHVLSLHLSRTSRSSSRSAKVHSVAFTFPRRNLPVTTMLSKY